MSDRNCDDTAAATDVAATNSETSLRRSKRNKYHLDVAAMLKSGSSSARRDGYDYSPPAKRQVTTAMRKQQQSMGGRSTAPAPPAAVIAPAKCPLAKRGKVTTGRTVTTVVEADSEHRRGDGEEEANGRESVEQNEEEPADRHPASRSISGGVPHHLDIQLPDQLLEEEECSSPVQQQTVAEQPLNGTESGEQNRPLPSEVGTSVETQQPPAEGKRPRKMPIRHMDYSVGEEEEGDDDDDEEAMFKRAKVEYTLVDGSRANDDHSCPKCPAVFDSRVGLTNHLKLHGAKKEFPCELCDFSCTNKKTMRQHRRVHGLSKKPRKSAKRGSALVIKQEPIDIQMGPYSQANGDSRAETAKESQISPSETVKEEGSAPKEQGEDEKEEEDGEEEEKFVLLTEEEYQEDAEGMPVLEQQEQRERSKSSNGTAGTGESAATAEGEERATRVRRTESGRELPTGYYKKGARIYDRNTVKCPHCPFRTQSKVRLQPHLNGHNRFSGFVCSVCGFKSEASGILRRHCQLHPEQCKWPPDYVGASKERTAELMAQEESRARDGSGRRREADRNRRAAGRTTNLAQPEEEGTEPVEGREDGEVQSEEEAEEQRQERKWRCGARQCPFEADSNAKVGAHRWREHQASNSVLPVHLLCRQCGLLARSGPFGLAMHRARRHKSSQNSAKRRELCKELLAERLAWRGGIEVSATAGRAAGTEAEGERSLSNEPCSTADETSRPSQSSTAESAEGTPDSNKVFRCRSCPFSTGQVFRLQKHENKHLLKSEHQCSHCTFSCRSLDILAQHMRLHERSDAAQVQQTQQTAVSAAVPHPPVATVEPTAHVQPQPILAADEEQQRPSPAATPKLAAIRRNEAHYCPHCPYASKHNCDMKAHLKMHEEKRKFQCGHCTYSTKRHNALLSHEQLHRKSLLPIGAETGAYRCLKRIFSSKNWGVRRRTLLGERLRVDGLETHFYRCAVRECSEELPFCGDLARHAKHHQRKGWALGKRLRCELCDFRTDLETTQRAHQEMHQNRSLGGAERNLRTDSGIFKCKECPYSTANYAKFWNHRQKHKRVARFTCPLCSFSSGSALCWEEHLALHKQMGEAIPKMEEGKQEESAKGRSAAEERKRLGGAVAERQPEKGAREKEAPPPKQPPQQRRSMDLPAFSREKFEQLSAALPMKQMKAILANGTTPKEASDSASTSSAGSSLRSSSNKARKRCAECPYEALDSVLLKLHTDMHRRSANRPFKCTLCSFGCFSAESLHKHLSLHASATTMEGSSAGEGAAGQQQQKNSHQQMINCSQCNLKFADRDQFLAHRSTHVQQLQQRLVTIIKRAAGDNSSGMAGGSRAVKAGVRVRTAMDKQHYCSRCSFRCDSVQAFTRHWEHHRIDNTRAGFFRCSACDYSSDTKNVVLFHERNHHLDIPLSSLCKNIELQQKGLPNKEQPVQETR